MNKRMSNTSQFALALIQDFDNSAAGRALLDTCLDIKCDSFRAFITEERVDSKASVSISSIAGTARRGAYKGQAWSSVLNCFANHKDVGGLSMHPGARFHPSFYESAEHFSSADAGPVSIVCLNGIDYIYDGHKRIAVAKALMSQGHIPAAPLYPVERRTFKYDKDAYTRYASIVQSVKENVGKFKFPVLEVRAVIVDGGREYQMQLETSYSTYWFKTTSLREFEVRFNGQFEKIGPFGHLFSWARHSLFPHGRL